MKRILLAVSLFVAAPAWAGLKQLPEERSGGSHPAQPLVVKNRWSDGKRVVRSETKYYRVEDRLYKNAQRPVPVNVLDLVRTETRREDGLEVTHEKDLAKRTQRRYMHVPVKGTYGAFAEVTRSRSGKLEQTVSMQQNNNPNSLFVHLTLRDGKLVDTSAESYPDTAARRAFVEKARAVAEQHLPELAKF
jgi:hypothetical protein